MKKLLVIILIAMPLAVSAYTFKASTPGKHVIAASNKSITDGLVAYYTFDGKNMPFGNVLDVSGNGNTGNMSNIATSTFYAPGKIGQAGNFDGVDDYELIPTITLPGAFTVSFWTKFTSTDATARMLLGAANNSQKIGTGVSANKFFVRVINAGSSDTAVNTPSVGVWHYIVLTRNTSNKVDLIIDGTSNRLFSDVAQSGNFIIDTIGTNSAILHNQTMTGGLDDVRIYNRALSSTEITQLYQNTNHYIASSNLGIKDGLVGYWTFDGKDMPFGNVLDVSGRGNTGNAVNMSTSTMYVEGKLGQALKFDGLDDCVTSSNPTYSSTTPYSISLWARSTTDADAYLYVETDPANGSTAFFSIQFSGSSGFGGRFAVKIRNNATVTLLSRNSTLLGSANGQWHHLVWVDTMGTAQLYIDGKPDTGNGSGWNYTPSPITVTTRTFGTFNINGNRFGFLNGNIDDVRTYNRALSAQEVKQLYQLGF